jgi:hypothetical protein
LVMPVTITQFNDLSYIKFLLLCISSFGSNSPNSGSHTYCYFKMVLQSESMAMTNGVVDT